MSAKKLSAYLLVALLSTAAFVSLSSSAGAEKGTADSFGYAWVSSDAPEPTVVFNWVDISASGTDVGFDYADDDCVGPLDMGFEFVFYGNTYTQFYISSNGLISLGAPTYSAWNEPIPTAATPNNFIAPFWDDLCVDYGLYNAGSVLYQTIGVEPERQLVVLWQEVSRYSEYDLLTFQVILEEATDRIWFQYGTMNGVAGDEATIGIENLQGSDGCQYSHATASVSDGLAVMFEVGPIGFGPDQSQALPHGSVAEYELTITNNQTANDRFDITYVSDQGWPVDLLDGSYSPLTDTDTSGEVDTGEIAAGGSLTFIVQVHIPWYPSPASETTVLNASSAADPYVVYDHATLTTSAVQASLTPFHSDYAHDDDSDGDFDFLTVNVSVNAMVTGIVHVECILRDSMANYIASGWAHAEIYLGDTNLSVSFPGEPIFRDAEDGAFDVTIRLSGQDWDFLEEAHYATGTYLASDFDPPPAMLSPPHTDHPYNDDSDGLYEVLVVSVSIEVFEAGEFVVEADLEDGVYYGTVGYASSSVYLEPGSRTIELMFPGGPMRELGLDTDYWVDMDLRTGDLTLLEEGDHTTSVYLWSLFEPLPVLFAPPYSDAGEDLDSDGYYDQLAVTIPIECVESGEYLVEVELFGWSWSETLTSSEVLDLEAGTTTDHVVLVDHQLFRREYIAGWIGVEMYLYNTTYPVRYDHDQHSTDYYSFNSFDPIGAAFAWVENEGRDTDLNGYYDQVAVIAHISPADSGDFEVRVTVNDPLDHLFHSSSEVVHMDEGVQFAYEFVLDAEEMRAIGYDGYWDVYLGIYDALDEYHYASTTHYMYYYLSEFEPVGAYFAPPHDDYGVDDDADGLYDRLVFAIHVRAYTTGFYDLEVELRDPSYNYDYYSMTVHIPEDTVAVVELEVDAYVFWDRWAYGYWHLNMDLYDHLTGVYYDSSYYDSGYHYPDEFELPPVMFDPPHSDYGLDTDSNTLYDYLVVEAELDCGEPGPYTVHAVLYDPWDSEIATASKTQSLTVANNVVELLFDGWVIWYNGISGYFEVELRVEDSSGRLADTDRHYCGYYDSGYFDRTPAEFSPPHMDHAADLDDDGLYESLVVTAVVAVDVGGDYVVAGMLYDSYGNVLDVVLNETALSEGTAMVELWFDGWLIGAAEYDPDYVEMALWDPDWVEMDADYHYLTGAYARSEFNATVPSVESGWAYAAPVVDGLVGEDEWASAAVVDLVLADAVNMVQATMYVMNDGENLYVLIDAPGDTTGSTGDNAAMAFDTGNDAALSDGREDWFSVEAIGNLSLTMHLVYDSYEGWWSTDCAPFDDGLEHHGGLAGAAGFGPSPLSAARHRVYEFSIPLALLGLSLGDTVGFAGVPCLYDVDSDGYSTWPAYFVDYPGPGTYGDLVISEERPLTAVGLSGDEGLGGWFVSEVEVTLTATGGTGGVDATYFSLDGGDWTTYTGPFTVDGDGLHALMFYSSDASGSDEFVRSVAIGVDTEAPESAAEVQGTEGMDGWLVSSAGVVFSADDGTSGLSAVMYSLDDGDWTALSGNTLIVSGEGEHVLEYYSADLAGNEEAVKSVSFKVDTSPPQTTVIVDGPSVTFTANDSASGVSAIMYRVDGGSWMAYAGAFAVEGKGEHTLEYYARDNAGNNETVRTVTVEGKAAGLDALVLAAVVAVVVLAAVAVMFLLMRRRPPRPVQMVPGEAVVEPQAEEPPPPPPSPQ